MFSRQGLLTIQAAFQRAASLRTAPARAFASAANGGRPPVYLPGLDGTYATALVCRRCVVFVVD